MQDVIHTFLFVYHFQSNRCRTQMWARDYKTSTKERKQNEDTEHVL